MWCPRTQVLIVNRPAIGPSVSLMSSWLRRSLLVEEFNETDATLHNWLYRHATVVRHLRGTTGKDSRRCGVGSRIFNCCILHYLPDRRPATYCNSRCSRLINFRTAGYAGILVIVRFGKVLTLFVVSMLWKLPIDVWENLSLGSFDMTDVLEQQREKRNFYYMAMHDIIDWRKPTKFNFKDPHRSNENPTDALNKPWSCSP